MPFLPSAFLDRLGAATVVAWEMQGRADGNVYRGWSAAAAVLLVAPGRCSVRDEAVERGEYKVFPVLETAGKELAASRELLLGEAFLNLPWDEMVEVSCT